METFEGPWILCIRKMGIMLLSKHLTEFIDCCNPHLIKNKTNRTMVAATTKYIY